MNQDAIEKAIVNKANALAAVYNATEGLVTARAELETVTVYFTNLGLEGTNEKARQAELATKTEEERAAVTDAEAKLRNARLQLDLANNELERIRLLLKLEETSVGTPA